MKTIINNKEFQVKQTGNRYFYWGGGFPRRWIPIAKSKVIFDE